MDLTKRTRQTVSTSTGEMNDTASRIVADLAEIRPAMQRNNEEVSNLVSRAYMMQEMLRQVHGTMDDLRKSQEMSTVERCAGSASDSLGDDYHTGTQITSRNPDHTFASDDTNVSALEDEDQMNWDFALTLLPPIRATSTTIYAEYSSCRWGSCPFHRWDKRSEIQRRLSALAAYCIKRITWRSRSAYTPVTGRQLESTSCLTIKFGQLFNHAAELSLGWSSAGSRFSIQPMCSLSVSVVIPEDDKRLQALLYASTEELQDLLMRGAIHPKIPITGLLGDRSLLHVWYTQNLKGVSYKKRLLTDVAMMQWYISALSNSNRFKDRTRNAMLLMAEGAKLDTYSPLALWTTCFRLTSFRDGWGLKNASLLERPATFLRRILNTQPDVAEDYRSVSRCFGYLRYISSDCFDIILDLLIANNFSSMEEFLPNVSEGQFKRFLTRSRLLLLKNGTDLPLEYLLSNRYLKESEIISCLEALLSKGFGHSVFNKHIRGAYYIRKNPLFWECDNWNNPALGDVYGTIIRSSHSLIYVALLVGKRQAFDWLWRYGNREPFQVWCSFDGKTEENHQFSTSSLAFDLGRLDWLRDAIMQNGGAAPDFPICSLCGLPGGELVTAGLLRAWSATVLQDLWELGRVDDCRARAIKYCECHGIEEIDGSSEGEGDDDGEGSEGEEQDFFDVVEHQSPTPDTATATGTRGPEKASPIPAPTRTRARSI